MVKPPADVSPGMKVSIHCPGRNCKSCAQCCFLCIRSSYGHGQHTLIVWAASTAFSRKSLILSLTSFMFANITGSSTLSRGSACVLCSCGKADRTVAILLRATAGLIISRVKQARRAIDGIVGT